MKKTILAAAWSVLLYAGCLSISCSMMESEAKVKEGEKDTMGLYLWF